MRIFQGLLRYIVKFLYLFLAFFASLGIYYDINFVSPYIDRINKEYDILKETEKKLPEEVEKFITCLSGCRRMITLKNDFNYFFNSYVSIHQVLLLCRDYRMLASIPLLWLN